MKTTAQWIEHAISQLNVTAYRLAKLMEADTSLVTAYRNGRQVISEGHAIKLGELLGIDPMPIVAAAAYERSKADHIRAFWARHAEIAGAVATFTGAILVGTVLSAPVDAQASTTAGPQTGPNAVYYVNYRPKVPDVDSMMRSTALT
jgi:hypothetical protein